jgi:hypothetical protein
MGDERQKRERVHLYHWQLLKYYLESVKSSAKPLKLVLDSVE